jgi:hypothetical protein
MMPELIDVKDFVVLPFYKLPVPEMPLTPTETTLHTGTST